MTKLLALITCSKLDRILNQNLTIKKIFYWKNKIRIATILICIFQFGCNHFTLPKGELSIIDTKNKDLPDKNLGSHKQYDVVVYRTYFNTPDTNFLVRYYQMENNTLNCHSAEYGDKINFNKASYHWLSDTSVLIRLKNTTTNKEKIFKVFGYGSRNAVQIDK